MLQGPMHILLQTTIMPSEDDWSIARFQLLRDHLSALRSADGSAPLFMVAPADGSAASEMITSGNPCYVCGPGAGFG